jgi:hypothetical protein
MSDIDAFGGVTETAPAADTSQEVETVSPEETQPALVEDPANDSTAETGEEAKADDPEDTKVDEIEAKEDENPDEVLDKQIDEALENPKTSKFYKNLFTQVKERTAQRIEAAVEPYKELGEPDAIRESVEWEKSLNTVEKGPNGPVVTARPFVDRLFEKHGAEKAVDVLVEIAGRPSPENKGRTLADEVLNIKYGIDPSRLPEIKQFAANGYRLQSSDIPADELELVREDLRDVYASLSQEERELIKAVEFDDERDIALRNLTLEAKRVELDKQRADAADALAKEEQGKAAEAEKVQKFNQEINETAYPIAVEAGGRVVDGFVTMLAEQAGLSEGEAFDLAVRVQQAIKGEGTIGTKAVALLKAEGVEIKPDLASLVTELDEVAGLIAYFRLTQDAPGLKSAESRMADIERGIGIKSKPIIAAVAKHRADHHAGRIATKNAAIDATQIQNRGIPAGTNTSIPLGAMPQTGEILAFPE